MDIKRLSRSKKWYQCRIMGNVQCGRDKYTFPNSKFAWLNDGLTGSNREARMGS